MIRAVRKIIRAHRVKPLRADLARLKAEYERALRHHQPRAHLAAKLQERRHELLRATMGI